MTLVDSSYDIPENIKLFRGLVSRVYIHHNTLKYPTIMQMRVFILQIIIYLHYTTLCFHGSPTRILYIIFWKEIKKIPNDCCCSPYVDIHSMQVRDGFFSTRLIYSARAPIGIPFIKLQGSTNYFECITYISLRIQLIILYDFVCLVPVTSYILFRLYDLILYSTLKLPK